MPAITSQSKPETRFQNGQTIVEIVSLILSVTTAVTTDGLERQIGCHLLIRHAGRHSWLINKRSF